MGIYLKQDTPLDFETKSEYDVTVTLRDSALPASTMYQVPFALTILDAPFDVSGDTSATLVQYEAFRVDATMAAASAFDGGFAAVWQADGSEEAAAGIYGQRFNAQGILEVSHQTFRGQLLVDGEIPEAGSYTPLTLDGLPFGATVQIDDRLAWTLEVSVDNADWLALGAGVSDVFRFTVPIAAGEEAEVSVTLVGADTPIAFESASASSGDESFDINMSALSIEPEFEMSLEELAKSTTDETAVDEKTVTQELANLELAPEQDTTSFITAATATEVSEEIEYTIAPEDQSASDPSNMDVLNTDEGQLPDVPPIPPSDY